MPCKKVQEKGWAGIGDLMRTSPSHSQHTLRSSHMCVQTSPHATPCNSRHTQDMFYGNPLTRAFERLVRKALQLPMRPAVVFLQVRHAAGAAGSPGGGGRGGRSSCWSWRYRPSLCVCMQVPANAVAPQPPFSACPSFQPSIPTPLSTP